MISDTKHFFFLFFCQSTHFQVLHYTQNKYLKKDLYKAQNAYNASRYGGIKKRIGSGVRGLKSQATAQTRARRGNGSKVKKVTVLQFSTLVSHQYCNTIAQESSRTDKRRCSHIHIKLSMYNCIQRLAPLTTLTNT